MTKNDCVTGNGGMEMEIFRQQYWSIGGF